MAKPSGDYIPLGGFVFLTEPRRSQCLLACKNTFGGHWGVSSIQPDDGGYQMDCGEEISSGFVVACGDSAEFLEVA
jgi:hypothetical protein